MFQKQISDEPIKALPFILLINYFLKLWAKLNFLL
jgi:hypothetical protein